MTWFFDQVYRSSNVFDYEVADLRSEPVSDSGFFDARGKARYQAETLGAGAVPHDGGRAPAR